MNRALLAAGAVLPHGFCYQWKPALVWLHAVSDSLIAIAYFLIPVALVYFVRKRRDIPFRWMFVSFGVFIAACGATHLMEVWTLWVPSYWVSGGVKVVTAVASVPTALFLVQLMPTVLRLPSTEEMKAANEELQRRATELKRTEERFRQMADNIQEIFWILDAESKEVTYVSPAFERICEVSVDWLYRNPIGYRELIHAEDRKRVLGALEELERSGKLDEEFRIVCASGAVKWIRALGFTARDAAGELKKLVGTAQEITARKRLEVAMRASEDRYRDMVEHSTDLICTHALDGRLLSMNELPAKLLGYTREEMLNRQLYDFLLPEARGQFEQSMVDIQRDGAIKGSMVIVGKNGERKIWEYHNTLRTEGVPTPIVRGIAHDVTERKQAERALRLSEEKFAKAFRLSPVEITITTLADGRFLEANESFQRNNGFTREEVIGHTWLELGVWTPEERTAVVKRIEEHGRIQDQEMEFRSKNGAVRAKRYSAEKIEIGGKQCVLAACSDVTLQKQIAEALRRSEEKFAKAFRNSPSIIWIGTLKDSILLEVNDSFERHLGYERNELLGRSAREMGLWMDSKEEETVRSALLEHAEVRDREVSLRSKTGQEVIVQISMEVIELAGEKCQLSVGQDITARKRAEQEFQYLAGQVLRLQDEERRKIARDLHDATGQNLVALATMLGQLGSMVPAGQPKARRLLGESKTLAEKCLREIRTMSYVLHPPVLDENGLIDAIRDYVKGFTKRSGIEVTLEMASQLGRMPREVEVALFRVVQESLTNIHRHSKSERARIWIDRNSGLTLEISEMGLPGEGAATRTNGEREFVSGVGLASMRERVKLIGGRLDIEMSESGTTVRVTLPGGGEAA